jgi:hypothetical protein
MGDHVPQPEDENNTRMEMCLGSMLGGGESATIWKMYEYGTETESGRSDVNI